LSDLKKGGENRILMALFWKCNLPNPKFKATTDPLLSTFVKACIISFNPASISSLDKLVLIPISENLKISAVAAPMDQFTLEYLSQ
jgi:hypothetical protein